MKFALVTVSSIIAALAAIAGSGASPMALAASAATPPPTPPPLSQPATPVPDQAPPQPGTAATPIPIPSGYGMPGMGAPQPAGSATPSPPPDARKGIDGVWEVQIQRGITVDYAHFKLAQAGSTLTGTFLDNKGKPHPLAGSVDGGTIRIVISMPDGTSLLLEGRLDGTTDMVGMFTSGAEQVPFTAAYRPKEKWIDNVNASPGGMGSPGGGSGGGGYGPP